MRPPCPSRGNALFLILIAVALFAALSYALSQSGRGGATTQRERTAIVASQITQYAATVQSAVQRMVLTGTPASSIVFCSSGDTDGACHVSGANADTALCDTGPACVFAPEGGGVAPLELPEAARRIATSTWTFIEAGASSVLAYNVEGVGTTTKDVTMHTAFGGITPEVCLELNKGLGLGASTPEDNLSVLGGSEVNAFPGEFYQCVDGSIGAGFNGVYVHVLIAR